MRLVPIDQKFDLITASHQFFYHFFILGADIALNACVYTVELDSITALEISKIG